MSEELKNPENGTDAVKAEEVIDANKTVDSDVAEDKKEEEKPVVPNVNSVSNDDDDDDENLTSEELWKRKFKQQKGYSQSWENKFKAVTAEFNALKEKVETEALQQKVISEKFTGMTVTPEIKSLLSGFKTEEDLNRQADAILKLAGLAKKEEEKPAEKQQTINPFQTNDQEAPKSGHWTDFI